MEDCFRITRVVYKCGGRCNNRPTAASLIKVVRTRVKSVAIDIDVTASIIAFSLCSPPPRSVCNTLADSKDKRFKCFQYLCRLSNQNDSNLWGHGRLTFQPALDFWGVPNSQIKNARLKYDRVVVTKKKCDASKWWSDSSPPLLQFGIDFRHIPKNWNDICKLLSRQFLVMQRNQTQWERERESHTAGVTYAHD